MAHSVTAATRNRLEVLPLELISMIFKNLGNDLVAHVTFSTLRSDIYDFCYKGLGPEFWRRILRASGISTLSRSVPGIEDWSLDIEDAGYEGPDKYETLARECVKHAEICSHPKCGMARIRANEELVRTRTERGASCMRTWDASLDDDEKGLQGGILKMNSVWDGIVFKKHAGQLILRPRCTWPDVSFVRPYASVSADDDDTLQYGDKLVQHPILWRSFASFPPVNKFGIMACGPDWIEPSNDRGVVVADVLQQILDADKSPPMNSADIAELIDRSSLEWSKKSDPWPVVPRGWTLCDTFNALQGIVDWLIIVRWKELTIEELFDKQIVCDMEFKAQKLPENYEDFAHLTTLNYQ